MSSEPVTHKRRNAEPEDFPAVLAAELAHLGIRKGSDAQPDLKLLFQEIAKRPPDSALSALCLSGGGIRSATFCLGVLQALTRKGLLDKFDYLSSVSGGGYIAGWLQAWLSRDGTAEVATKLVEPPRNDKPLDSEAAPLDHLRAYSNYLTPRLGLFSADTWAFLALTVRNLLLNWLVLLPALAALIAVPQITFIVAGGSRQLCTLPDQRGALIAYGPLAFYSAIGFATIAAVTVHVCRRRRFQEGKILTFAVVPLWISALALSASGLWQCSDAYPWSQLWPFSALWSVIVPVAGWGVSLFVPRRHDPEQSEEPEGPSWLAELLSLIGSGVLAGALLAAVIYYWLKPVSTFPALYVSTAVPILLGVYLLSRVLFVAFVALGERKQSVTRKEVSPAEMGYADREWWARFSGWILLCAIAWIIVSGLIVLGALGVRWLFSFAVGDLSATVAVVSGALSLVSGLGAALLGSSSKTAGHNDVSESTSKRRGIALTAMTLLSIAGIVVLLASLVRIIGAHVTAHPALLSVQQLTDGIDVTSVGELQEITVTFAGVAVGLLVISALFGAIVNVNRFSAHGLYRNRLMRAYLGASNSRRKPDPFTGFDPHDNIRLADLTDRTRPRPLAVINTALNLVRSDNLAWQQRKAESFSMTPLYCGNYQEGYRPSREYGGSNGITLATAMTISGAAANPNAGYHSAPLVSFLMTLFNVRLGCWLPNTNQFGRKFIHKSGPAHAGLTLFKELLSLTDRTHAFVNLSDGGHFENLGVYEMILRRCRLIVAIDAGQDAKFDFEDLGNLIRKVRIDFGVPVEFDTPIQILARDEDRKDEATGMICALGAVRYSHIDKTDPALDGHILYIKPTLRAAQAFPPYDVVSYSRSARTFPHESTGDQWFSEAQFESYRALGEHLVTRLVGTQKVGSVKDLFLAAAARLTPQSGVSTE